jgi:hypothetical protein
VEGVGRNRERCNRRLAPKAIKVAAEKALEALGVTGIALDLKKTNRDKAGISVGQYKSLKKQLGCKLEPVGTVSGASAERALIGETGWELKVYRDGTGQYSLTVGKPTRSVGHVRDWAHWQIGRVAGMSPNADNAEAYAGISVVDARAHEDLGQVATLLRVLREKKLRPFKEPQPPQILIPGEQPVFLT